MKKKTLIFDMDGVIFDSENCVFATWDEVAKENHLEGIRETLLRCIGTNRKRTEEIFAATYGEDFPYDTYKTEQRRRYHERYDGGRLPTKPGIKELLDYLQEHDYHLAIASSTRGEVVKNQIRDAGFAPYFEHIVSGEMVAKSKPEPDIFLLAANLLGADPATTYVIEDSYNGIRAAKAAGMIPIMVPDLLPPTEEMNEISKYIVSDLYQVIELLEKESLNHPTLAALAREEEIVWINPDKISAAEAIRNCELCMKDIDEAEARLARFASFIKVSFPETEADDGLIESPLREIPAMKQALCDKYGADLSGKLLLKMDSHLAIAGSIKARGGIYEVLKHAEDLAFEHGILKEGDDYAVLAEPACKEFFGRYTVQVGSTGNLGLSIGIMSAAVGFKVVVHMSADAKQWKKELLRSHGVTVVEYESDYSKAVENGRAQSDADPMSYFVDDENSKNLFLGYAVAAKRLKGQLAEAQVTVDAEHPLFVYIPCGVGGAPGGVAFGLKQVFGDHVHCFFVEPTKAPCMVAGMASGLNNRICVQDLGLSGLTHADGLAVGRPSGFVGAVMKPFLSGEMTIADPKLYEYMRDLLETEEIFIEPSASAAFEGPVKLCKDSSALAYLNKEGLDPSVMKKSSHIVWATGGRLVPEEMREEYRNTYL